MLYVYHMTSHTHQIVFIRSAGYLAVVVGIIMATGITSASVEAMFRWHRVDKDIWDYPQVALL